MNVLKSSKMSIGLMYSFIVFFNKQSFAPERDKPIK